MGALEKIFKKPKMVEVYNEIESMDETGAKRYALSLVATLVGRYNLKPAQILTTIQHHKEAMQEVREELV